MEEAGKQSDAHGLAVAPVRLSCAQNADGNIIACLQPKFVPCNHRIPAHRSHIAAKNSIHQLTDDILGQPFARPARFREPQSLAPPASDTIGGAKNTKKTKASQPWQISLKLLAPAIVGFCIFCIGSARVRSKRNHGLK